MSPPWRRIFGVGLVLALPLFPWLLKSYAATGNPVYPFGFGFFHSYDWSSAQETILRDFLGETTQASGLALYLKLPAIWWNVMRSEYLFTLLLLPGFFLPGFFWRPALGCVLAQLATLMLGHSARYLLPTAWYIGLLASLSVSRLYGWPKKAATVILVTAGVANVSLMIGGRDISWREILLPQKTYWEQKFTSYELTARALKSLQAKRILSVGERLVYRLPGRIIYGGQIGETHLVWKMASEAGSSERMRIKFKQLGADYLLYNYVSVKWLSYRYAPFLWNRRMLDIYKQYWMSHHEVAWRSDFNDVFNGGQYLFRIRDIPLSPVPSTSWFLPGTEQLYAGSMQFAAESKFEDLLELCLRALALLPEIGNSWTRVGEVYFMLRDSQNAYKYLADFARAGMIDESNIYEFGVSAGQIGRLKEAEEFLRRALVSNPEQRYGVRINLAELWLQNSMIRIGEGDLFKARANLEKAEDYLAQIGKESPSLAQEKTFLGTKANSLAVRGEILLRAGLSAQAAECFRRAAAHTSSPRWSEHWRAIADELAPRKIGF
jgi:tetratricopeptide (TPR) repeat protein